MIMKSYDKASWHIDGGENELEVITRFKDVFTFLADKRMLNAEGLETFEFGMDDSASLNSNMLTSEGEAFLDAYYDVVLSKDPKNIAKNLQIAYEEYTEKK